jgi:diguanylate cyclase (GGDEF)-like protein
LRTDGEADFFRRRKMSSEPDDGLGPHRERALYPLSVAAVVCFTPFSINNWVQGQLALGAVTLCVTLVFGVNAAALHRGQSPPIPFWALLVPTVPAVALSLRFQGIYGAFWCYPMVLFFYFALSRRMANVCSGALLLTTSAMVALYIGPPVAVRFFASLMLTIIVNNIALNVIAELQGKLLQQAIEDPLTGAFNRRHMEACLTEAIERNKRTKAPASILLFDIDHFKRINDEFGHAAGDAVLKDLVARIGNRARTLDVLCRVGGEEFVVLLPDTSGEAAATVADHLRGLIASWHPSRGGSVTVSIGVSELLPGDSIDDWMKRADERLYLAKQAGRNRVVASGLRRDVG